MSAVPILVRQFREADADQLLALMRELAKFEGYIDEFRVTKGELLRRGFGPQPEFFAIVAEASEGDLAGMAVGYLTPFTYTLKPSVTLKELFVRPSYRSTGLGRQLLVAFARRALAMGAGSLRWTVLGENHRAKLFYKRLGGVHDSSWEPWVMHQEAMERLVDSAA